MKRKNLIPMSCALCMLAIGCGQQQEDASSKTNETPAAVQSLEEGDDMGTVTNSSIVLVDYVGTFPDGEMFDTSIREAAEKAEIYDSQRTYEPLQVIMGQRQVISGFEEGLLGMKIGETKTVSLAPEKAYGPVDAKRVQLVPVSAFASAGIEPVAGEMVQFQSQTGRPVSALIREVQDDSVVVDMNHPLAGKTLNFRLTVRQILSHEGS